MANQQDSKTFTQIYTPVLHSNGERLVQITDDEGVFRGWADGRGKFDISGTWEIVAKWNLEQAGEYARQLESARSAGRVEIVEKGVQRIVSVTL